MRKLFLVEDSTANKISYYHLAALLFSLPYDRFYSHLILISLSVHTVIHFNRNTVKSIFTLTNLMIQVVFFLTLTGILYTTNKSEAFSEMGRQAIFLLLPLIFCINNIDLKKYRNHLLTIFSLSCTIAMVYLYLHAFSTIKYYGFPLSAIFTPAFINHNFAKPIDMHATFLSMQIALALIFLLSELTGQSSFRTKTFYTICCCLLAAGIIQLSSKSVSVALMMIVLLAFPYFKLNGKRRTKFMVVSIISLALLMFGIYQIDNFKERYVNDLQKDLSEASDGELTDPRLARWKVALKLAAESPVIGHGSGTEIGLLKDRFFEKKFYRSFLTGLNSHNQFISFLIKSGIIGLSVYLMVLFWGFKISLTRKDLMLFTFLSIITAVSFSENYLDVDKGVFFYGVFFSFFIFSGDTKTGIIKSLNKQKTISFQATKEIVGTSL